MRPHPIFFALLLVWTTTSVAWELEPTLQTKMEEIAVVLLSESEQEAERVDHHRDTLLRLADGDRVEVLSHLFYNIAQTAKDETKAHLAMGLVGVFYRMNATSEEVVSALAPQLTQEPNPWLEEFLGAVDSTDDSGRLNFQPYIARIQNERNSDDQGNRNLIRYMMTRDPVLGLRSTMDALEVDSQQRTSVETTLTAIEASFEKRVLSIVRLRFPDERIAVQQALESLANRSEWWLRLFVSEIVRQEPLLGTQSIKSRLSDDPEPRVRASISEYTLLRVLTREEMRDAIENRPANDPLYVSALSDFLPTCTRQEMEFLLRTARLKGGWTIMINLGRSLRYRAEAGETELADHFIDYMQDQLSKSGARIKPAFCVAGLGRLVNLGEEKSGEAVRPYAFDRVTEILIGTLDQPNVAAQREAIRSLADVARVDNQKASQITTRLVRQREIKESDSLLPDRHKRIVVEELDQTIKKLRTATPDSSER